MQRPLIPAPTMTQSTGERSFPSPTLKEEIVDFPATEHRNFHGPVQLFLDGLQKKGELIEERRRFAGERRRRAGASARVRVGMAVERERNGAATESGEALVIF